MEVSPRGGGNRISEILKLATSADLIQSAVRVAVGLPCSISNSMTYEGVWAELILYSDKKGLYKSINIDKVLTPFLIEQDIWVKPGDLVQPFTGANETIGTLIFKFNSREA